MAQGTLLPNNGGTFDHYDENGRPVDASGNPTGSQLPTYGTPGQSNLTPWIPNTPGTGTLPGPGTPGMPNPPPWIPSNPTGPGVPQATATPSAATPTSTSSSGFDPGTSGANSPFNPWSGTFTAPTPTPLPTGPTSTGFVPPPNGFSPTPVPTPTAPPAPPTYTPPTYTPPPAFVGPTAAEALNDPGYKFRVSQGMNALQGWAAAKGTLNDSGTAKALTDYGQNAASQEFQNAWQRAVDLYKTNYQSQYTDPYTFAYQGSKDAFAPQMAGFGANVNANTAFNQAGVNAATASNTAANNFNLASNASGANTANLVYTTNAANTQNNNNVANTNAWNNYYLSWQDLQNRRTGALNFALAN